MSEAVQSALRAPLRAKGKKRLAKQVGSFGVVGIINTLLDFAILNFCRFVLSIPAVPSNLISTSIAQIISFVLNKKFVFKGQKQRSNQLKTALQFIVITMASVYLIQTAVIYVFVHLITFPGALAYSIAQGIGLHSLSMDFVVLNTAKVIATVFSAAWNFVLYKKIVFKAK